MDPAQAADPPAALPRGTRLAEFELLRVLGIGGFGIVYLALDHALEREVAIKEYMPSSLVGRSAAQQVSLLSQANAESFALGLRSFVNEARLLARFDHPALVKVHRYWEANGTAYMAMPYYTGRNLHAVRRRMDQPPHEAWLRGLLEPLLGALERLHREGVYHRDISPDNVILQPDGQPVLLDFGAARRVLGDKSMALTAILKPAYAPIEQYGEAGAVRQGPWTDLYALGATLHFLLLGRAPMPATTRMVVDEMRPLASQQATLSSCSTAFLHLIDSMLQPRPADRPQSVAALREALTQLRPPPAGALSAWDTTQALPPASAESIAPTLMDLAQLQPPTGPAPPLAGSEPTQLMTRHQAGEPFDPTQLLAQAPVVGQTPASGPDRAAGEPARAAASVAPAATAVAAAATAAAAETAPVTPLIAAAIKVPPETAAALPSDPSTGRDAHVEPELSDTIAESRAGDDVAVAVAIAGERRAPSALPARAGQRWPLGVGAAALLGLGLWLALAPAKQKPEASTSAGTGHSASADAASSAALTTAPATAASVPEPAAVAAPVETAAAPPPAGPNAANAANASITPLAAAAADRPAQRPATAIRVPAAASAVLGSATDKPGGAGAKAVAAAAAPAPAPVRARAQAPAAAEAPSMLPSPMPAPSAAPGLATSITRLPPATDGATTAAPVRPSATPGQGAADPPRPAASAAVTLPALAAAQPPPAAAVQTAASPRQAAVAATTPREADPVLLQARSLSPSERCEGRVLLALWSCIERVCKADAGLREHADCVKQRRDAERGAAPTR